jgi:hypothetical protein
MIKPLTVLAALTLLLTACFRIAPPEPAAEPRDEAAVDALTHQTKDACEDASTITIGGTFTLFGVMYVHVVLEPGASISGAGEDAYIACSVTHVVDSTSDTLFFPIGDDDGYRPVELRVQQDSATATPYTAEVFPESAYNVSSELRNPLKRVSQVRYWQVDDGVTQPSTLSIAHYNDSWDAWRRVRARAQDGTITTREAVTTLEPENYFTLGDVSDGEGRAGNPLR